MNQGSKYRSSLVWLDWVVSAALSFATSPIPNTCFALTWQKIGKTRFGSPKVHWVNSDPWFKPTKQSSSLSLDWTTVSGSTRIGWGIVLILTFFFNLQCLLAGHEDAIEHQYRLCWWLAMNWVGGMTMLLHFLFLGLEVLVLLNSIVFIDGRQRVGSLLMVGDELGGMMPHCPFLGLEFRN